MAIDKAVLRVEEAGCDEHGPRVVLRGAEQDVQALARHLFSDVVLNITPIGTAAHASASPPPLPPPPLPPVSELQPSSSRASASGAAPSPWAAKGFTWDDVWGLQHIESGIYVAMANGQFVTILNEDLSESASDTAPEGIDPRLFAWNQLCARGWHGLTDDDAVPEVAL
jgi:hypothetical protein